MSSAIRQHKTKSDTQRKIQLSRDAYSRDQPTEKLVRVDQERTGPDADQRNFQNDDRGGREPRNFQDPRTGPDADQGKNLNGRPTGGP